VKIWAAAVLLRDTLRLLIVGTGTRRAAATTAKGRPRGGI